MQNFLKKISMFLKATFLCQFRGDYTELVNLIQFNLVSLFFVPKKENVRAAGIYHMEKHTTQTT